MARDTKHPLLSFQPLKFIFQLAYIGTIVTRLPAWLLISFIPRFRPHPKWTPKQTLMTHVAYAMTIMKARIGVTPSLSLEPGKEGNRFRTIKPSPSQFYQGPLASGTEPAVIGGTWFPSAPDLLNDRGSKKIIVLYLHGGAFIDGDGRTDDSGGFASRTLAERGGAHHVFSVQYRLSGYAGLSPFPAALQDALTSYLFLLHELQIPAHQIAVAGDSAGGNLVIALLRYIAAFGSSELQVPAPRCAVLLSPWVAPLDYEIASSPNFGSDYLSMPVLRWGAKTYAGRLAAADAANHPYITPLGKPFATPVPIFTNAGSTEIFLGAITRWVDEMRGVGGNSIELNYEEAACHDTLLLGEVLGFEDSARGVAERVGAFIQKL